VLFQPSEPWALKWHILTYANYVIQKGTLNVRFLRANLMRSSSAVLAGEAELSFSSDIYQLNFATGEWALYIFMGFSKQWKNSRKGSTWPMCIVSHFPLWILTPAHFLLIFLIPLTSSACPITQCFIFPPTFGLFPLSLRIFHIYLSALCCHTHSCIV